MASFEYTISLYPIEQFKELAFFCSDDGTCKLEEIPGEQINKLLEALNDKGKEGWELVVLFSRPSGLVAIWKRRID